MSTLVAKNRLGANAKLVPGHLFFTPAITGDLQVEGCEMARINVDESLFKDNRFNELCISLKSSAMAVGALVQAWLVAQEYWKNSDEGIPKPAWKKLRLNNEIIN